MAWCLAHPAVKVYVVPNNAVIPVPYENKDKLFESLIPDFKTYKLLNAMSVAFYGVKNEKRDMKPFDVYNNIVAFATPNARANASVKKHLFVDDRYGICLVADQSVKTGEDAFNLFLDNIPEAKKEEKTRLQSIGSIKYLAPLEVLVPVFKVNNSGAPVLES